MRTLAVNKAHDLPMTLDQRFAEAMGQMLGPDFPSEIGLAVSGGGDSMAMLALAHNCTCRWGVRLWVVTVNHGFRTEALDEARMVARECALLGWPHATLHWAWDGQGNKMEAAREARLRLIAGWRGRLRHVLMAHTRDDVAETYLMRLARGSGVDGLSAMAARRVVAQPHEAQGALAPLTGDAPGLSDMHTYPALQTEDGNVTRTQNALWAAAGPGFEILRPCLGMRRAELRHYARVLQVPWVEDPSNDDPIFARARVRAALPALADLGLDVPTLASTADRMMRARDVLRDAAAQAWDAIGEEDAHLGRPTGDLLVSRDGCARLPEETQLRLLAGALCFVSGTGLRPRAAALDDLLCRVLAGGGGTLHGCEVLAGRDCIRVFREFAALSEGDSRSGTLWDGRWCLSEAFSRGMGAASLRPLGDRGWHSLTKEHRTGLTYRAARSLPMVADDTGAALVSVAQGSCDIEYRPMGKEGFSFREFLLSH